MTADSYSLLVGFMLGCMITSGIWTILWALLKSERRIDAKRVSIMQEIDQECAEIDIQISSLNMNGMHHASFRSSVSPRLDKISKTLTTNLHLFNVYYVKYIESLIAEYRQILREAVKDNKSAFEKTYGSTPEPGGSAGQQSLVEEELLQEYHPPLVSGHEMMIPDAEALTLDQSSHYDVTQELHLHEDAPTISDVATFPAKSDKRETVDDSLQRKKEGALGSAEAPRFEKLVTQPENEASIDIEKEIASHFDQRIKEQTLKKLQETPTDTKAIPKEEIAVESGISKAR